MKVHQHGEAFDEGFLAVSDLHSVYYAQYGKPDGKAGTAYPVNPQGD